MCPHHSIVGDNYGTTCMDCGAVVSGYGNFAEGSQECHHVFFKIGEGEEQCMYCERIQKVDAPVQSLDDLCECEHKRRDHAGTGCAYLFWDTTVLACQCKKFKVQSLHTEGSE